MPAYSSLRELWLTRLREFYRQPARIFWVYAFPTILAIILGVAFKSRLPQPVEVTLVDAPSVAELERALGTEEAQHGRPGLPPLRFQVQKPAEAEYQLKTGRTPLVVMPTSSGGVVYRYDPTRPEANTARVVVDDALERAKGRPDLVPAQDQLVTEPGSRYIDFLIPGLIGLNTMGGGLWGIGFLLVNMRIGKLLKRFAATPMPRRDFLLSLLGARLVFLIPDVTVLLLLGVIGFQMPIRGNLLLVGLVVVLGALAFAGIGLLIASRAQTTETVSGLMNMVMMPMWLMSGVFFDTKVFPKPMQPLVEALPLTQLVRALRLVILEGAGLATVAFSLSILVAWAAITFLIALRIFRWT